MNSKFFKKWQPNRVDVIVAFLSAMACLLGLFGLPAWAAFIGWAWYIALNIKGLQMRTVMTTAIASALLAFFAIIVTDALAIYLPTQLSGMIAVFIAILGLMIWLKGKGRSSLVGFNSFSCIFAGYYLGGFPAQEGYVFNLLAAFVSITGCNIIGLLVGWLNACWCQAAPSTKQEIEAKNTSEAMD